MNIFQFDSATTAGENEFKLNKIISSRIAENSRSEYLVQWVDSFGSKRTAWESTVQLVNYMKMVTQFRLKELGRSVVEKGSVDYFGELAIFEIKGPVRASTDKY